MNRRKKYLIYVNALLMSMVTQAKISPSFNDGEELFRTAGGYGCSTCHGLFAQGGGNVGGNIRGKALSDINASLNNEPTMLLLNDVLTTDDRKSLEQYLKELGNMPLVDWTIDNEASEVKISLEKGVPSQLVILNKQIETLKIDISPISDTPEIIINPYETQVYEWTPEPGIIKLNYKQNKIEIHTK
jgi:hypothetical protein